jgi:glycosyltransferase involved in cell wall biosynthesis
MPLRIAAKIDNVDRPYWNEILEPMLRDDPLVEFVGEIDEVEKQAFLGNAAALVFPIDWPEPFGLVMIEAMACGTPVLAFDCGSVPEVIDDGISGHVVATIEDAAAVLPRTMALDRTVVRAVFDRRFSAARMARDYLALYRRLIATEREPSRRQRDELLLLNA